MNHFQCESRIGEPIICSRNLVELPTQHFQSIPNLSTLAPFQLKGSEKGEGGNAPCVPSWYTRDPPVTKRAYIGVDLLHGAKSSKGGRLLQRQDGRAGSLYKNHQESGSLRATGIPTNNMYVFGAFVVGLAWL